MGKVLLILVVLITAIFATLSLTMRQSTSEYVDSMNTNIDNLKAKEISNYVLDYAIRQIDNGTVSRNSDIPFIGNGKYNLNVANFTVLSATVDSIYYSCIDVDTAEANKDTILIRVIVSHGGTTWASEAILGSASSTQSEAEGFWDMDSGGGGSTIHDGSGNGYDGHLVNTDTTSCWVAGYNGMGLNLDGSNDRVDIDAGMASTYDDQMTVASWCKMDHSFLDWGTIAAEQTQAAGYPIVWTLRSRLLDLWFYKSLKYAFDIVTSSTIEEVSISKNNWQMDVYDWHFIVGSYDGEYSETKAEIKIHIYDEGFENSKIVDKWANHADNNAVSLGGWPTSISWFGAFTCIDATVDEIRILDGIYDPSQLTDIMNDTFFISEERILSIKEYAK